MTTLPLHSISFAELLHWERTELDAWIAFFEANPHALELPYAGAAGDDPRMATVRGVVHHIVAVERRYADRLAGDAVTPYDAVPASPDPALFAAARDANARLARWVADAGDAELARIHEFQTISAGTFRVSARKVVAHAITHGVRTWAQVATVLRLAGARGPGKHDFLYSDAMA